ncbi:MAG TPA: RHS repeat domain-containing protein [Bryobacteraceae bacterium]|jgi:YD repeat-containing protein
MIFRQRADWLSRPATRFNTTRWAERPARPTRRTLKHSINYDALGRLIQVTDALGQLTKYTYDEVGDRISQTDANTHTTTFAYDPPGRRTQRTLPLGESESMTYDAAGNLKTKTDRLQRQGDPL